MSRAQIIAFSILATFLAIAYSKDRENFMAAMEGKLPYGIAAAILIILYGPKLYRRLTGSDRPK